MQVFHYSPKKPNWQAYLTHLHHNDQARWVLDKRNRPKFEKMVFLGIEQDNSVIASLTLKVQPIVIPATEWAGGKETVLKGADGKTLTETFVQTFHVVEAYRRRGLGEQLQQQALAATRDLGCYQMRSWSSLDRGTNYQLKLKLGFAAHPAVFTTDGGLQVSGIYFVAKV